MNPHLANLVRLLARQAVREHLQSEPQPAATGRSRKRTTNVKPGKKQQNTSDD